MRCVRVSRGAAGVCVRRGSPGGAAAGVCGAITGGKQLTSEHPPPQVEEDNMGARSFYRSLGYVELFTDPASRRYDASSFFLRNVRTSKMTLRKELELAAPAPASFLLAAVDQIRSALGGSRPS